MAGVVVLRRVEGRAVGVVEVERGVVVMGCVVMAGAPPTGDRPVVGVVPIVVVAAPGTAPGTGEMVPEGLGTVVPGATGVPVVVTLGVVVGVGVPTIWAWAGRLKATRPSRAAPPKRIFVFITKGNSG